jgi:predicted DCC family thiol-disulfide oxidoreductase YuxK
MSHPILLYDGVCGLCNRLVQFILRRDPAGVFRFASLQSPLAGRILGRHGADSGDLDTVYVVFDYELPNERLVARSDAVVFILKQLAAGAELRPAGQPGAAVPTQATPVTPRLTLWRGAGFLLQFVPRAVRDWGYGVVAHNRYRLFGRYDSCPLPSENTRSRFLDL